MDATRLVGKFYDAAVGAVGWTDAIDTFCHSIDAVGVVAFSLAGRGAEFSIPMSPVLEGSFQSYIRDGWYMRDERFRAVPLFKSKPVVVDLDFASEEEIRRSPYYQEFLAAHDLRWSALIGLDVEGSPWIVTIQRTISQGPFSPAEVESFVRLAPHLSRSFTLQSVLERSWAEGLISALDAVACPAFLVNGQGQIDRLNRMAEALLGHGLDLAQGRLHTERHEDQLELEALTRAAVDASSEALVPFRVVTINRAGKAPLLARVIPLRRECGVWFGHARALLLVSEVGGMVRGAEELVRRQCGLTRAEAEIAAWLAEGRSVEDFAGTRMIATSTARQLCKQVLAKTGTHRQSQLVALVKNLQAALGKLGGGGR